MTYIHRQHLTVITHHCTGFQCFHYPLSDQSLRELALRILEAENRPAPSRVQQELQLSLIFFRRLGPESSTAKPAIDPQPCPDQERATPALLIQRQHKTHRMHQVRLLPDYPLSLPQRLTHPSDLSMLQIAQASVNDPRRPARRSRGTIMLLDQTRPLTAPVTLAHKSDAV